MTLRYREKCECVGRKKKPYFSGENSSIIFFCSSVYLSLFMTLLDITPGFVNMTITKDKMENTDGIIPIVVRQECTNKIFRTSKHTTIMGMVTFIDFTNHIGLHIRYFIPKITNPLNIK